jgi:hypothetical protein
MDDMLETTSLEALAALSVWVILAEEPTKASMAQIMIPAPHLIVASWRREKLQAGVNGK